MSSSSTRKGTTSVAVSLRGPGDGSGQDCEQLLQRHRQREPDLRLGPVRITTVEQNLSLRRGVVTSRVGAPPEWYQ